MQPYTPDQSTVYESGLKQANLEACEKLICSMTPGKGYSSSEIFNLYNRIVDTQLAPAYGDLSCMKTQSKIGGALGTLVGLGFLKSEETQDGALRYRNTIEPKKLGPALSVLFKHRF
jgi:hypothetical protein